MATKTSGPLKPKRARKASIKPKAAAPRAMPKAKASATAPKAKIARSAVVVSTSGPSRPVAPNSEGVASRGGSALIIATRKKLGVTQNIFARLIGATERSVSGWEQGKTVNAGALRRIIEMDRLAEALGRSMKKSYIPSWLVTPNEALGSISPVEALERGENDRLWRTVFFLGSGMPI